MVAIQAADAETDAFGAALSGERARLDIITARDTLEVLHTSESA